MFSSLHGWFPNSYKSYLLYCIFLKEGYNLNESLMQSNESLRFVPVTFSQDGFPYSSPACKGGTLVSGAHSLTSDVHFIFSKKFDVFIL